MDFPRSSPALLPALSQLAARRADLDDIVLIGMGGSSLAAEVIASAAGRPLTMLDTTDCRQVEAVLGRDPERMLVILSSKSGETIETNSLCRVMTRHLAERLPPHEAARHCVAVTDPGSLLHRIALDRGYEAVLADPSVGGRYSALGPFGLVAGALLGTDVDGLLADAAVIRDELERVDNPGWELGSVLADSALAGRGALVLDVPDPRLRGLGDWIEQLVAESTGKDGRGILPVVGGCDPDGSIRALLTAGDGVPGGEGVGALGIHRPLGAQFLLWEYATVIASRVLGVNPFDQPNVEESKANTATLLAEGKLDERPDFTEGAIEVHTAGAGLKARTVAGALSELTERIPPQGYLAVMSYLDRERDAKVTAVGDGLRAQTRRPVTFGWGPRLLHSVGQYHKGGPSGGVFCQITGAVKADIEIPGRPFTLAGLQAAQAGGDRRALLSRGRTVLRLHLRDRENGIEQLVEAAAGARQ
ncbi:hypothetical protein AV521_08110 [Streptomyces sp. IMTB 2501]|uniref:hypothetical protein n=1 Tax=Streptomyces sp. IMTB 2501 TaxID=1776340 RepID=UPI00096E324A|nr:hypothetical protein [Streptomyces sp. IMTB 2501]OLZ72911.1 hypothetical protein AV521_08110 [Streptomyces sp. IMTB 2501]